MSGASGIDAKQLNAFTAEATSQSLTELKRRRPGHHPGPANWVLPNDRTNPQGAPTLDPTKARLIYCDAKIRKMIRVPVMSQRNQAKVRDKVGKPRGTAEALLYGKHSFDPDPS